MTSRLRDFRFRLLFGFLFCMLWTVLQTPCSWAADTKSAAKPAEKPATKAAAPAKTAGSGLPQVIDFGAQWCVPCKKFAPVFDKVAANYKGKVDFIHCDIESKEGKPLVTKYKVGDIVPVIMFVDAKGKMKERFDKVISEEDLVKHTEALIK